MCGGILVVVAIAVKTVKLVAEVVSCKLVVVVVVSGLVFVVTS